MLKAGVFNTRLLSIPMAQVPHVVGLHAWAINYSTLAKALGQQSCVGDQEFCDSRRRFTNLRMCLV